MKVDEKKPDLLSRPFYRARLDAGGKPAPWTLEDLEAFAAEHDDPFGGRHEDGAETPPVSLQIEATGEPPIWLGLDGRELGAWAGILAAMWRRFGLSRGETIAFFEYGSSPLVLLASSSYVAWLKKGAADRLGASAVCNDGVTLMASRMASIVENVRPAALVVRRDVLVPFADALRASGTVLAGTVRWVAVSEPEGAPLRRETDRFAGEWDVPVHRILRADAAHLLAGECRGCGAFHLDRRSYRVEHLDGDLALTARFARTCPTIRHSLGAGEVRSGCRLEPGAVGIVVD